MGWGGEWCTAKRSSLREEEETSCHLCEVLEIPLIHPDARHTVENYKIEINSCMIRASPNIPKPKGPNKPIAHTPGEKPCKFNYWSKDPYTLNRC